MLAKLYSIRASAWSTLALLAVLATISATARSMNYISPQLFMYVVQPIVALAIAGAGFSFARHRRPKAAHDTDKVILITGVVVLWFVLYFLSGLICTYVRNSLFTGVRGVTENLWQFGIVAAAVECARYNLMKLVSRRNMLWFGFVVSCVLAVQQMNFSALAHTHGAAGLIQLCVADFVPSIFSSFTLTYLAITCGLSAQLVYRLGLVAILVLPPIIPKYDWYVQGITLMLLAVAIYVAVDRNGQADVQHPHRRRSGRSVFDAVWLVGIVALVCFMTGVFNYRPYAIPTYSMVPTYSRGAMVVVQKIHNPMDVKVGDIVQYKTRNVLITHRVTAIGENANGSGERVFTVKGDNNPAPDAPVAQDQVVGIVRLHVPFIGYPTVWLTELSQGGQ